MDAASQRHESGRAGRQPLRAERRPGACCHARCAGRGGAGRCRAAGDGRRGRREPGVGEQAAAVEPGTQPMLLRKHEPKMLEREPLGPSRSHPCAADSGCCACRAPRRDALAVLAVRSSLPLSNPCAPRWLPRTGTLSNARTQLWAHWRSVRSSARRAADEAPTPPVAQKQKSCHAAMTVMMAVAQMSDTPLSPAAREPAAPAPPGAPREPLVTPAAPPQQLGCSKCRHASRGCGACRPRTGTGGSRGPGSRPGPSREPGQQARRSGSRQREGGKQAAADGAAPAPGPERSGRAGGGPTPGSGRPAEARTAGGPRRATHMQPCFLSANACMRQ